MKFGLNSGKKILVLLGGLLILWAAHFVGDYNHFQQRTGFSKFLPYVFLILMYGWILFHNLILFDGQFLKGKKNLYFVWTFIAILICTFNMFIILYYVFQVHNPFPQLFNFWLYTLLGLGVYVIFKYLKVVAQQNRISPQLPVVPMENMLFHCTIDGEKQVIPYDQILFIESLENYIRINTPNKKHLVRLSMKEAEDCLPNPLFLRISRSNIVNTDHISRIDSDTVILAGERLKIGKVYKKFVEDRLTEQSASKNSALDPLRPNAK